MPTVDEWIGKLESEVERLSPPGPFHQHEGNQIVANALWMLLELAKEIQKEKATTVKRPPPLQTALHEANIPTEVYHSLQELLKLWSEYLEDLADRLEKKVQED